MGGSALTTNGRTQKGPLGKPEGLRGPRDADRPPHPPSRRSISAPRYKASGLRSLFSPWTKPPSPDLFACSTSKPPCLGGHDPVSCRHPKLKHRTPEETGVSGFLGIVNTRAGRHPFILILPRQIPRLHLFDISPIFAPSARFSSSRQRQHSPYIQNPRCLGIFLATLLSSPSSSLFQNLIV